MIHATKQNLVFHLECTVLCFIACRAAAEDAPDFQSTIRKVAESRAGIKSYELSVQADVDDDALPQETTVGTTFVPSRKLVAFTLDVVSDAATDSLLVARRDRFEDLVNKVQTTQDWHVYVTTPDRVLVARDGNIAAVDHQRVEKPRYFDPLGLGLAFEGEYFRGDTWKTTVNNYLEWKSVRFQSDSEGVLRYSTNGGDVLIEIDSTKDFWPVKLQVSLDRTLFVTETKLGLVVGRWLPESARVKTRGMETRLRFTWKSVNSPVAGRFRLDDLKSRYAVTPSDLRSTPTRYRGAKPSDPQ